MCALHAYAKWFMYIQYMSDSANFSGHVMLELLWIFKKIIKIKQDCNLLGHRYDELLNVLERN